MVPTRGSRRWDRTMRESLAPHLRTESTSESPSTSRDQHGPRDPDRSSSHHTEPERAWGPGQDASSLTVFWPGLVAILTHRSDRSRSHHRCDRPQTGSRTRHHRQPNLSAGPRRVQLTGWSRRFHRMVLSERLQRGTMTILIQITSDWARELRILVLPNDAEGEKAPPPPRHHPLVCAYFGVVFLTPPRVGSDTGSLLET